VYLWDSLASLTKAGLGSLRQPLARQMALIYAGGGGGARKTHNKDTDNFLVTVGAYP
jgi:hypothetical protein